MKNRIKVRGYERKPAARPKKPLGLADGGILERPTTADPTAAPPVYAQTNQDLNLGAMMSPGKPGDGPLIIRGDAPDEQAVKARWDAETALHDAKWRRAPRNEIAQLEKALSGLKNQPNAPTEPEAQPAAPTLTPEQRNKARWDLGVDKRGQALADFRAGKIGAQQLGTIDTGLDSAMAGLGGAPSAPVASGLGSANVLGLAQGLGQDPMAMGLSGMADGGPAWNARHGGPVPTARRKGVDKVPAVTSGGRVMLDAPPGGPKEWVAPGDTAQKMDVAMGGTGKAPYPALERVRKKTHDPGKVAARRRQMADGGPVDRMNTEQRARAAQIAGQRVPADPMRQRAAGIAGVPLEQAAPRMLTPPPRTGPLSPGERARVDRMVRGMADGGVAYDDPESLAREYERQMGRAPSAPKSREEGRARVDRMFPTPERAPETAADPVAPAPPGSGIVPALGRMARAGGEALTSALFGRAAAAGEIPETREAAMPHLAPVAIERTQDPPYDDPDALAREYERRMGRAPSAPPATREEGRARVERMNGQMIDPVSPADAERLGFSPADAERLGLDADDPRTFPKRALEATHAAPTAAAEIDVPDWNPKEPPAAPKGGDRSFLIPRPARPMTPDSAWMPDAPGPDAPSMSFEPSVLRKGQPIPGFVRDEGLIPASALTASDRQYVHQLRAAGGAWQVDPDGTFRGYQMPANQAVSAADLGRQVAAADALDPEGAKLRKKAALSPENIAEVTAPGYKTSGEGMFNPRETLPAVRAEGQLAQARQWLAMPPGERGSLPDAWADRMGIARETPPPPPSVEQQRLGLDAEKALAWQDNNEAQRTHDALMKRAELSGESRKDATKREANWSQAFASQVSALTKGEGDTASADQDSVAWAQQTALRIRKQRRDLGIPDIDPYEMASMAARAALIRKSRAQAALDPAVLRVPEAQRQKAIDQVVRDSEEQAAEQFGSLIQVPR